MPRYLLACVLASASLVSILPATCLADARHVPGQYASIQLAIDAAVDGDSVVVAPGTYAEPLRLSGKRVTLRSSGGSGVTTLDGQTLADASILLAIDGETLETIVEGFTFTNGQGSRRSNCTSAGNVGGAMYVGPFCGLTVRDCRFIHNGYDRDILWGAAIYAHRGSLRVTGCDFVDNGLYASDPKLGALNGASIGLCGNDSQTLEVTGCTFINNFSGYGSGIMSKNTVSALVSDCQFAQNESGTGGGINIDACGEISVLNCSFDGNSASHGGGAWVYSCGLATVEDCTFTNNQAAFGAGLNFTQVNSESGEDSIASVRRCTFGGNDAGFGGGMFAQGWYVLGLAGANPRLEVADCRFESNTAAACCNTGIYSSPCWKDGSTYGQTYYGGGADLRVGHGASVGVFNCVFAGNAGVRGGGLSASTCGEPDFDLYGGVIEIVNCTVHENTGTGLDLRIGRSGEIRLANSIVRENTSATEIATLIKNPVATQAHLDVVYSNVEGGFVGAGNTDADPLFVDPAGRDYRLAAGSPSIDVGDSGALPLSVTKDLDGLARRVDDPASPDTGVGFPPIDLGAHEFQPCPADFDGSGFVDTDDFTAFVQAFEAGTDDADFDRSGFVDTDDFTAYVLAFEEGC